MTDANIVSRKVKVITIGDQSVGKTSIIRRFLYDSFELNYTVNPFIKPTIGIDFASKQINVESRAVKIQVWDTAGQERFKSLIPSYIKDSHVVLLIYDITKRKTLTGTDFWFELIKKEGSLGISVFLVGNKMDLDTSREITREEGEQKAREMGASFFETSAKTGEKVNEIFMAIAQQQISQDSSILSPHMKDLPEESQRDFRLSDEVLGNAFEKKKPCCN